MRLLTLLFLAASAAWACTCKGEFDPCESVRAPEVAIFVARVTVGSDEGGKPRPATLVIEEALQNVPVGLREIKIDTGSMTSCDVPVRAGERYVIISQPPYSVGGCGRSFLVEGNEIVLEALRNAIRSGPSQLLGHVSKSVDLFQRGGPVQGASVTLSRDGRQFEAVTDDRGRYLFSSVEPGRYRVDVSRPGYVADSIFNQRARSESPGTVLIGMNSCSTLNLAMWPTGLVSGTVRDRSGNPVSGVEVQAFRLARDGVHRYRPLRTSLTAADGSYAISPLPAGRYAIGVNGRSDLDESPYPPTLYGGGEGIDLPESGTVAAIDLIVPPPRTPASLTIRVVGPDGQPFYLDSVSVSNLQDFPPWSVRARYGDDVVVAPAFIGETYIVRGEGSVGTKDSRFVAVRGAMRVDVRDANPTVVLRLVRQ